MSKPEKNALGELRDSLAVIQSSLVILERHGDREDLVARHVSRIRHHLAQCERTLQAAGPPD